MVHWVSGGGRFRSAWLNAAPLEVATLLRDRLFVRTRDDRARVGDADDR